MVNEKTYQGRGKDQDEALAALKKSGSDYGKITYECTVSVRGSTYAGERSEDYGRAFATAIEAAKLPVRAVKPGMLEVLATAESKLTARPQPAGAERSIKGGRKSTDLF